MTNELLQQQVVEKFPEAVPETGTEWPTLKLPATQWKSAMHWLKNDPELALDSLFCLTCVDWKTHLTMVYHLTSNTHRHTLVIKCDVDRQQPEIETACRHWRTAEFHEREVYELFGVQFINHPDLRTLILPDGWDGRNPMRKDFDDPVNMIKL